MFIEFLLLLYIFGRCPLFVVSLRHLFIPSWMFRYFFDNFLWLFGEFSKGCWWIFDALSIFNASPMHLLWMFDGFSFYARCMFGRYSIDAPFPTFYLPFPISHFLFPMSMCLFDRRLPISHCRWLGLAECAERLNPPPLPYGKSWRVRSKARCSPCGGRRIQSLRAFRQAWPSAVGNGQTTIEKIHRHLK